MLPNGSRIDGTIIVSIFEMNSNGSLKLPKNLTLEILLANSFNSFSSIPLPAIKKS